MHVGCRILSISTVILLLCAVFHCCVVVYLSCRVLVKGGLWNSIVESFVSQIVLNLLFRSLYTRHCSLFDCWFTIGIGVFFR